MSTPSSVAFLFPGQGAQAVGMGADVYTGSPAGRAVFDEADTILGFALSKLILEGPAHDLVKSDVAQPAILCASLACLRAAEERLREAMPRPAFVAGHSLGEYTALVAAGALDAATALRLVRRRGELMQAAAEAMPGGMAAVLGMPLEQLRHVCAETGAQIANVNGVDQIVIAGPNAELERAMELAKAKGARRVVRLEVAGAFHTEVMRPAQVEMAKVLQTAPCSGAAIPVVANTTAHPIWTEGEIRNELTEQLCGSVLWQESMSYMVERGVTRFIEFGPGKVLSGLAKRIAPNAAAVAVGELDAIAALT